MDMRAGMEAETNAILESLCGPGLFGNLVDSEVTMYLPKPKARFALMSLSKIASFGAKEFRCQFLCLKIHLKRIPFFAIIDEIGDDLPAAEDGLQLSDEIVKFGSVKKGHNLQSRLVAEEAQSNQGNQIPSVIVRQGALMSIITVTPRPWHGPGSLGYVFFLDLFDLYA
ncbi:hypothetical protein BHM03_00030819 [Ensete ventricosum]|nr:hypothetical protein BHM03_00030819 [Ensete ventricosum]